MVWVLVCVLVVAAGAVYLFLQGREVWRKSAALLAEIDVASRRAGQASRPTRLPDGPEPT